VYGNFIGTDAAGTRALGNGVSGVLLETAYRNWIGGTQPGAGNLISGNKGDGVWLVAFSQRNVIAGNRIGTNAAGNASLGNGQNAVLIQDAQLNLIGPANVLSGTNQYGVWINHPLAKYNHIEGNLIGTDVTGASSLGNRMGGVLISDASDNFIGGSSPGAGNLISGNGGSGIRLFRMTNTPGRTAIQGNRIGTDISGTSALGNSGRGIDLSATVGGLIGGITEGARNLISGNGSSGILLHDEARECLVQGNFAGTDITGALPLGNTFDGIFLENSPSNLVGGATPGAGNLVSGNGNYGIHLLDSKASGNRIQGNMIGTDLSGALSIGNASAGIFIKAATGNTLGGILPGEGNTIAFNLAGTVILSGTANPILSNSMFSNTGLGIDAGEDGVTANDEIDSDTGANNSQNYPILTKAVFTEELMIEGSLRSAKETDYLLQFFSSEECDGSGFGEGRAFIGSATTTTDSNGAAEFSVSFHFPLISPVYLTSTATDPEGNTSEFSECLALEPVPTPTPTSTVTFTPMATMTPTPLSPTQTPTPEGSSEVSDWPRLQ
jgi:titin